MTHSLPPWFQADQVFCHDGRWFFGSKSGLHVGPYADRSTVENKSLLTTSRLQRMKSDGERMRYVRELLREEWEQIRRITGERQVVLEESIEIEPPPMEVRRGEAPKNWYRSDRFFQVDDVWFFSTREGIDIGPYCSLEQARRHERRLTKRLIAARDQAECVELAYEYKHQQNADLTPESVSVSAVRSFRNLH